MQQKNYCLVYFWNNKYFQSCTPSTDASFILLHLNNHPTPLLSLVLSLTHSVCSDGHMFRPFVCQNRPSLLPPPPSASLTWDWKRQWGHVCITSSHSQCAPSSIIVALDVLFCLGALFMKEQHFIHLYQKLQFLIHNRIKCNICDAAFISNCDVKRHMKKHNNWK